MRNESEPHDIRNRHHASRFILLLKNSYGMARKDNLEITNSSLEGRMAGLAIDVFAVTYFDDPNR